MAGMSPQDMAAMQDQSKSGSDAEGPQDQQGKAEQLAQQAGEALSQLADVLPPGAKDQMAQILSQFASLIDKVLGGGDGHEADPASQVPAEGGLKGVPMGPQGRM